MEAVEQICSCEACVEARAKKANSIHGKVIEPIPSHYAPELSPNYFDNKSPRIGGRAF